MITISNGTAVVTGAASGIGAIYADHPERRGYDLILVARSIQVARSQVQLDEVARRVSDSNGPSPRNS